MKYECHITINKQDLECTKLIVNDYKFYTSQIEGDIDLGDGLRAYCTSHSNDYYELLDRAIGLVGKMEANGINPIRVKIEEIKMDLRF